MSSAPTAPDPLTLTVDEHNRPTVRRVLSELALSIGRSSENDIVLGDRRASRRHLLITFEEGRHWVTDQGSQNGTLVNGRTVRRAPLSAGDRIQVGQAMLTVANAGAEGSETATSTLPGTPEAATPDESEHPDSASEPIGGARAAPAEDSGSLLRNFSLGPAGESASGPLTPDGADDPSSAALVGGEGVVGFASSVVLDPGLEAGSEASSGSSVGGTRDFSAERLERVRVLSRALNADPKAADLFDRIVDAAIDLTASQRGFLLVRSKAGLEFGAARDFQGGGLDRPEFELSWSIAIRAATRGEALLVSNAQDSAEFAPSDSIEALGLRSVVAVPIHGPTGLLGAIYVDQPRLAEAYGEEDASLLELLADQAGLALETRRLLSEVQAKSSEVSALNLRLEQRIERQAAELDQLRGAPGLSAARMIGSSARMDALRQVLERIGPTELPVLIQGESGTGKELVAQAIHRASQRADRRFFSLNCSAVPEGLFESELFGHVKGAFTGADANRPGLFAAADGGTLFLDEVSEMPLAMQSRLLRTLQEGEIRPVGASRVLKVDVRVIAACNRKLEDLVAAGSFREDLYYRLKVLPVDVPPLRERREDIPELVAEFLRRTAREPVPRVSADALDILRTHPWPGNVRQLENEMRRLAVMAGDIIGVDDLGPDIVEQGSELVADSTEHADLGSLVEAIETREIRKALSRTHGNKTKAAERLGITRFTLQRKLDKYGIVTDDEG